MNSYEPYKLGKHRDSLGWDICYILDLLPATRLSSPSQDCYKLQVAAAYSDILSTFYWSSLSRRKPAPMPSPVVCRAEIY